MTRFTDISVTALAPVIWGSTYIVTTEFLPQGYPLTAAMLRALPMGLLLTLYIGRLPGRAWVSRIVLLGAFNFTLFWTLLFISAYRLPGGVAAIMGASQAVLVIIFARMFLGAPVKWLAVFGACLGMVGVAALILTPQAALDPIGIAAGIGAAASMATGTVFARKWRPPDTPLLAFTAWQLLAGGVLLLPLALAFEPPLPSLTLQHVTGFVYLGLIGAGLTYALWFRGVERIEPSAISALGFLSPLSAIILGWVFLGQALSVGQWIGEAAIALSIILSQLAVRGRPMGTGQAATHGG